MAGDAPIAEAKVRLRPDASGFAAEAQTQIVPAVGDIKKTLLGLAGAGIAIDVFKGGLDELKQQQQVLTLTDATLKATGGSAGVTAGHISDLAEQVQQLTGKDKEAAQAGMNLLLQFRDVRNEVGQGNDIFDRASKLAVDLSIATGRDLTSSYRTLGLALEDPTQGMRALRQANIILDEAQKAQIKSLVDQGDKLGAQRMILGLLEKQVGGVGDAYGKTLAGKLERAGNVLDDVKAKIVGGMAPALEAGADLADKFGTAFEKLPAPVTEVLVGMAALTAAMKLGGTVIAGVQTATAALSAGFDRAAIGAYNLSGSMGTVAAKAGIAAAAMLAVAGYTKWYADSLQRAREEGDAMAAPLLKQATAAGETEGAYKRLTDAYSQAEAQRRGYQQAVDDTNPLLVQERNTYQEWANAAGDAQSKTAALIDVTDALAAKTGKSKDEVAAWVAQQARAGTTYQSVEQALQAYTGKVGDHASAAEDAASAQKRLNDEIQAAGDRAKYAKTQVDQLTLATMDLVGQHLSQNAAQREITKAQEHLNEVYRDPKASASDRAEAEDQLVAALDRKAKADADAAEQVAKSFGVQDTAKVKADAYKTSLEGLAGKFPILNQYVDELKAKLDALPAEKDITIRIKTEQQKANKAVDDTLKALTAGPSEQDKQRALDQIGAGYPGHAAGGPVSAGVPTIVGEAGRELFIPETNGTIVPNHAMTGGGGTVVNQYIYGWNEHPDQIRRDVLAGVNIGLTGRQAA